MEEQLEILESIEVKKCLYGIQTLSTLVMKLESKVDEKVSRDDFEKLLSSLKVMSDHIVSMQKEIDHINERL